jgi:NAD(P)H-dependent FMN reductase
MPTLMIVIASTRPGRIGLPLGRWMNERAAAHGAFEIDLVDLAELGLPFMDEPHHPRLGRYTRGHTLEWSARVAAADAFVFVTPEYNFGLTAPLKNAIDYLHHEWHHKPVGFMSYGGVSAGTRAVQMLKQVVTGLRMMPMYEGVAVPFVRTLVDVEGRVTGNEAMETAAMAMLDELVRWEAALRPLRAAREAPPA